MGWVGVELGLPEGPVTVLAADAPVDSELLERYAGVQVATHRSDETTAAFASPHDALRAVFALPRRDDLRLGLHTLSVDRGAPLSTGVARAHRIRDVGHPGQVLLSRAAADAARDDLPRAGTLLDLGVHRLRDLGRPEHLWQLVHPALIDGHPSVDSLDPARTNLPIHLTSFVGRHAELDEVVSVLGRASVVTLTGAGGCGKTRLATHAAADQDRRHSDGVWFVDLAPVDVPDGVVRAVADVLRVSERTERPAVDAIAGALGNGSVLFVLDNCEHLAGACGDLVEELVRRCPGLRVLATSREPLGIEGELTLRVPSLRLPDAESAGAVEPIDRVDSVALFVDRALQAEPRFVLDSDGAEIVADICRRLDGLPLAIELAASRLRTFTLAQIRDALSDRFRVLTGGARRSVPRQQTLQASVDWSHALLLDSARLLFRRLSVFAGAFDLAGAEAVGAFGELERHHILDLLSQLVEKSLVVAVDHPTGRRYRLLETMRHYAAGRLDEAGETDHARRLQHRHYLQVVQRRASESDQDLRARVAPDDENVRRALHWAGEQADPGPLVDLVTSMDTYWATGRGFVEPVRWVRQACDRAVDDLQRARTLRLLASFLAMQGEFSAAADTSTRALDMARQLDDAQLLAWTLIGHGMITLNVGEDPGGVLEEGLDLAARVGDRRARAFALEELGWHLARDLGDPAEAWPMLEEALELARAEGFSMVERLCVGILPIVRFFRGEVDTMVGPAEEAARRLLEEGEGFVLGTLLSVLTLTQAVAGADEDAARSLATLGQLADEMGDLRSQLFAAIGRASAGVGAGDWPLVREELGFIVTLPLPRAMTAMLLAHLVTACDFDGDAAAARTHADHATQLADGGPRVLQVIAAFCQAVAARTEGEDGIAEGLARDAVTTLDPDATLATVRLGALLLVAGQSARHDRYEEATRVFGSARADARRIGVSTTTGFWRSWEGEHVDACRAALGGERVEQLLAEGDGLGWNEVVAYVRRGRGKRRRPTRGWQSLTPTERQVAAQIAAGARNQDVSERLFMSVATVKSHLTHIYAKLGITSRAQLAAEVARRDEA